MQIRRWSFEDVSRIAELEKVCFSDPWNEEMIADCFNRPDFAGFLCEERSLNCEQSEKSEINADENSLKSKNDLIGYAGAIYAFDEADVALVAVAPAFRKCGFAAGLMKTLLNYLAEKGVKKVFLEVRVSNIAAQNLYKKLGFSVIGQRKNYYVTEDALVMSSDI